MRFLRVSFFLAVQFCFVSQLLCQHSHVKFTPTSRVFRMDENTWGIGAETVLPPPNPGTLVTDSDLYFKLPPNGTVKKVQATVSFAFPWGPTTYVCGQPGEVLAYLSIDGKHFAPVIQKLNSGSAAGSREVTTFISYDIPIKYTNGNGALHVEANPFGCWSDWEIQGTMRVEF